MTAIKYNHEFAQDQSSSAFNVNKLSRYLEDPKEMRRKVCKRILGNLEETSNYVFFFFLFFNYTLGRKLKIEILTDANWGADKGL